MKCGQINIDDDNTKRRYLNRWVEGIENKKELNSLGFIPQTCMSSVFNMIMCSIDLSYVFTDEQLENIKYLMQKSYGK